MQAVVGESVKPGQFLKRQIGGIPVMIYFWRAVPVRPDRGILLQNRGFPALPFGAGVGPRLTLGLPSPERRAVRGGRFRKTPLAEAAVAGFQRFGAGVITTGILQDFH
jgi:hypothetical protein